MDSFVYGGWPTFFSLSQSEKGCPVLAFFARAGGNNACTMGYHAERIASHLRCPSPALYHLLLLSPITVSAHRVEARPISHDSGTDSPAISLCGRGIRGHARTHSSSHHRTRDRKSIHGDASFEATHRPRVAAKEKADRPTPEASVWRRCCTVAILAGSFLRFQRVDDEEPRRETQVHASQSGEARTGQFARRMALEYRFYFLDEAGPVRVNEGWSKISFEA